MRLLVDMCAWEAQETWLFVFMAVTTPSTVSVLGRRWLLAVFLWSNPQASIKAILLCEDLGPLRVDLNASPSKKCKKLHSRWMTGGLDNQGFPLPDTSSDAPDIYSDALHINVKALATF